MVTNITSLTGNGLRDWLIQRISALILVAYLFFIVGFILANRPVAFEQWHGLFQQTGMRIFSLLCLLSLITHSWIGIWTITTDYLPKLWVRLSCQMILFIAHLVFLIWGILILWGL